jgi:hypothetical protein
VHRQLNDVTGDHLGTGIHAVARVVAQIAAPVTRW